MNYKKIFFIIIGLLILVSTTTAFALEAYQPLEPGAFPGINTPTSNTNLSGFLEQVFNYGISIAVVLALVMIIVGGIEYMTTDSWDGKSDGKKKITDALKGLALALVSYLILYTINPCIVVWTAKDGCDRANTFLTPTPSGQVNK